MSMFTPPQPQHQWLKQLIGTWSCHAECVMEPGQPPFVSSGTEAIRALGELWIVAEGKGQMPGGGTHSSLMTLGYDPGKHRFIGTWIGSIMSTLFLYEGELDATQRILPLHTTGPNPADPAKQAHFQDVIEIISDSKRLFWSQMRGDDGHWHRFMTATYTRIT